MLLFQVSVETKNVRSYILIRKRRWKIAHGMTEDFVGMVSGTFMFCFISYIIIYHFYEQCHDLVLVWSSETSKNGKKKLVDDC